MEGEGERDARRPIVLGHEPPFTLGPLKVEPALRRLSRGGEEEFIQPRVMQVLVALARSEGEVLTRDDLIESCWAGAIVTDDALNRIVSQVRKLADGIGQGAFTVETVARVGYRMHRPKEEAVPAPAPPQAAVEPGPPAPKPARRRRAVPWLLGLAALLVIAVAGWWLLTPQPIRTPSLAVAPFELIDTGVPADLPARIDADLHAALSANRIEIEEEGADWRLTGSVRREGAGLRFAIRVDDVDGANLIAFTRDLAAGQPPADLARYLARFLTCSVRSSRYPGRLPRAAAALVQQICMVEVAGGPGTTQGERLDRGRALVREVPDFAFGWHLIAEAIAGAPLDEAPALLTEGRAAAERAIALDPASPMGYADLATLTPRSQPVERERLLRRAVELSEAAEDSYNMQGWPQQWLGDGLLQSGRFAEAKTLYQRGADQDRYSGIPYWRIALVNYAKGEQAAGEAAFRHLVTSVGTSGLPPAVRVTRAALIGDWGEAAALMRAARSEGQAAPSEGYAALESRDPARIARAAEALGEGYAALESRDPARIARAGEALERLPADADREDVTIPMLALLGRSDAVFAALDRSITIGGVYSAPFARPGFTRAYAFDPRLRALRRDPRFAEYLRRAGFFAYWRATGSRPDECANADSPPYCRLLR